VHEQIVPFGKRMKLIIGLDHPIRLIPFWLVHHYQDSEGILQSWPR
jgi:hypothetical protein